METTAIIRYARITPRKARRVIDLIRGKKATEAMVLLKYMPYRGAKFVEKALKSAIANAEQRDNKVDIDNLKIVKAMVDQGPMMKRLEPRAMGRANIIKKRTCHIKIILSEERS
ncbi:MAG: 50S ribosomal protein L22 [Thermodesulfovibrionales bacterium]|nr:50S ribosomal protein L22 [Thermodesulfovibrionales bacterium]